MSEMKQAMKKMGLIPTNEHRRPKMPATMELERRPDGIPEHAGLLEELAEALLDFHAPPDLTNWLDARVSD